MIQKILEFLKSLFTQVPPKIDSSVKPPAEFKTISHIPVYGEISDAVGVYQSALVSAGEDPGPIDKKFQTLTKAATSRFQKKNGLDGSGYPGEQTIALLGLKVLGSSPVKDPEPVVVPPGPTGSKATAENFFNAVWVKVGIPLLGMYEWEKRLSDILVPWWKKVYLSFSSLVGRNNAWCSLVMDYLIVKAGYKGTSNAMALSWRTWGKSCPYWFGAVLGLRHASGGGHVTIFLYWIDKSRKIAACMGGNQGDEFNVSAYNLSGNAAGFEEVVGGPRWPFGAPDGVELTAAQVQALFKHTVKGKGSTT